MPLCVYPVIFWDLTIDDRVNILDVTLNIVVDLVDLVFQLIGLQRKSFLKKFFAQGISVVTYLVAIMFDEFVNAFQIMLKCDHRRRPKYKSDCRHRSHFS